MKIEEKRKERVKETRTMKKKRKKKYNDLLWTQGKERGVERKKERKNME